jgi:ribosomal protein S1
VTVEKVEAFGVFVGWEGGRGLVPNVELGIPHGTDARRTHPPGTQFRAVIQEVRSDGKVRLSKVAAQAADERATAAEFMSQQNLQIKKPKGDIGSLGELLLQKLGKK